MKLFYTKIEKSIIGEWKSYYVFGKKIYTKLVCLYRYI